MKPTAEEIAAVVDATWSTNRQSFIDAVSRHWS